MEAALLGSTGTAIWVPYRYRVLLEYRCCLGTAACVPQTHPIFSQKKFRYGSGTGWVRIGHKLGTGREENSQNYIIFPEKIKTLPDIFLTLSLPPLSRVGYRTLSLDISLSLLSLLCRHSLKSSLYRPRSSTGMKLPALPMLAAPSYHSKLLWVLACFICFSF